MGYHYCARMDWVNVLVEPRISARYGGLSAHFPPCLAPCPRVAKGFLSPRHPGLMCGRAFSPVKRFRHSLTERGQNDTLGAAQSSPGFQPGVRAGCPCYSFVGYGGYGQDARATLLWDTAGTGRMPVLLFE
jgi:hypothetical protein